MKIELIHLSKAYQVSGALSKIQIYKTCRNTFQEKDSNIIISFNVCRQRKNFCAYSQHR